MNKKQRIGKLLDEYSILLVLVVLVLGLSLATPNFLTVTNIMNLLSAESARGLLALGVSFCIISKGIDLSLGSVIAVAAVVSASLAQDAAAGSLFFPNLPHLPLFLPVVAGLLAGVLFGLINGLLVAYTHIPAFIATLGTMTAARGVALLYTNAYPISYLREDFKLLGQGKIGAIPCLAIVLLVFALLAWLLLNRTSFGRNIYAIGGNETAARVAGVPVERSLVGIYVWSALTAAVAGILIAARSGSAIASLGMSYELDGIAAATVGGVSHSGGVGKISGIVTGILILGVINNGLLILGVSPYIQQIIKGCIIVGAVVFDMRKANRR
ncbi:hypothetical protein NE562_16415 [Butyricicoccus faecihominis]|uniref:ABC transporter permease n=1 Tax=Butyricicoccus faecihominis TaxID=1712515 RepID=UPI00247A1085|nr:hypothetical protein [Butyricicoccus faecihominis]MCQ5131243.1 hypothetical protein [Butyricicoccus faecihominis]